MEVLLIHFIALLKSKFGRGKKLSRKLTVATFFYNTDSKNENKRHSCRNNVSLISKSQLELTAFFLLLNTGLPVMRLSEPLDYLAIVTILLSIPTITILIYIFFSSPWQEEEEDQAAAPPPSPL